MITANRAGKCNFAANRASLIRCVVVAEIQSNDSYREYVDKILINNQQTGISKQYFFEILILIK